jgi:cation diffusion facilitator CzcD-associated flavoprotein CzcO
LIIGAGPFGLSLAAYAGELGIDHVIVGEPMSFWKDHMPSGMYLRSACDWHFDASGVDTIEAYLREQGKKPKDVEPLPLDFYLGYPEWFIARKRIEPLRRIVTALHLTAHGQYLAVLDDGSEIMSSNVVVAVGFVYFARVPPDIAEVLPTERCGHTLDGVDLKRLAGKRVLIIGGRQSAFEWAALLAEAGADEINVSYRHETPSFAPSDWTWVGPLLDRTIDDPAWFRSLSIEEQGDVSRRLWGEGRLKLEPWLGRRIAENNIRLWPKTRVVASELNNAGSLDVRFDTGDRIDVDEVIFATGYAVDVARVPFLREGNILQHIAVQDGFPVLDTHFQTTSNGLFITSMAATRDFGPFFGFTVAVRASARLIGDAVAEGLDPV